MTLTFWKFKGVHLCTYVFPCPLKLWQLNIFLHLEMHASSEEACGMWCCISYRFFFFLLRAYERLKVTRFTLLFSEKEKLFSLLQFIAHCGNLFWAHQKVYNITQLSCLELWLLWCCLDSSRFCKQLGLVLKHKE